MRPRAIILLAAAVHVASAFHPPERVGAGSARKLARPPGPLDRDRSATRQAASYADLASELAAANGTDSTDVAPAEKQLLPFLLGAGALSAATYGVFLSFQETHAPGLAVSALCLFGCWAALASRALA